MVLATHGYLDRRSPLLSHISLGEELRIIDIVQTLKAPDLIIFAACFSGLGTATAANDVTGFSNALLSTGCKAFIGPLWEVNDVSTMFLLTLFYERLREATEGDGEETLDEVFVGAQRDFYGLNEESAKDRVRKLIKIWDEILSTGLKPARLVRNGRKHLERILGGLGEIEWRHPFHFAGMALNGWGGLRVKDIGVRHEAEEP